MKTLRSWLFPTLTGQLDAALKRVDMLETEIASVRRKNEALWRSYKTLQEERDRLQKSLRETRKLVRDQTDADLMLVSIRIIRDTINGKLDVTESDVKIQAELYHQAVNIRSSPYNTLAHQLGQAQLGAATPLVESLGLGKLFG